MGWICFINLFATDYGLNNDGETYNNFTKIASIYLMLTVCLARFKDPNYVISFGCQNRGWPGVTPISQMRSVRWSARKYH